MLDQANQFELSQINFTNVRIVVNIYLDNFTYDKILNNFPEKGEIYAI